MAEFICPNCGNNKLQGTNGNIITDGKQINVNDQYVCTECSTPLSNEHRKELIAMAVSEASANLNQKTAFFKLLKQARQALLDDCYPEAVELYQQLQEYDPDNWEPTFFITYCRLIEATDAVENVCNALEKCLKDSFDRIGNLPNDEEKASAIELMALSARRFALYMFDNAVQQYLRKPTNTNVNYRPELKNKLISALNIMIVCADNIMSRYGSNNNIAQFVKIPAACALEMQSRQTVVTLIMEPQTCNTFFEWIGRFDPQYVADYKAKQYKSMKTGTIFLMILGIVCLILGVVGIIIESMFMAIFFLAMALYGIGYGIFRMVITAANKKLNG